MTDKDVLHYTVSRHGNAKRGHGAIPNQEIRSVKGGSPKACIVMLGF